MSGIINSAGSKSGVIGTTELPYEEGTWTAVPNAGSIQGQLQNRYTRIGGMCWCSNNFNNIQGGFGNFSGLPFTTRPSGTSYDVVILSGVMTNGISFPSGTGDISMYLYNMTIYLYCARDNAGWLSLGESHMENNDDMQVAFGYQCQ